MNQLVPLQPGSIPAHIQQSQRLSLNANAHANLQASFAVLRTLGKEWSIRYRGEDYAQKASPGVGHDGRPLPEMKIEALEVVVVGMAAAVSKKYYIGGYQDGASQAPDCFSIDGIAPDLASAHKQNPTCATCPQNIWGSATTQAGRKAKACRDGRRIAVTPAFDLTNETYGGPMLLDVPPTSLSVLDTYVRFLERQGADVSEVVTRISFREGVAHQEFVFECVGWVPPEAPDVVLELNRSDTVHRMLNEGVGEVTHDPQTHTAPAPLPARPTHLQAVAQPHPRPSQPPLVRQAAPQGMVATPGTPAAPLRPSPFQQAGAAAVAPAPAQPAPQPAPAPVAEAVAQGPTVVQGAPADMMAAINELMGASQ